LIKRAGTTKVQGWHPQVQPGRQRQRRHLGPCGGGAEKKQIILKKFNFKKKSKRNLLLSTSISSAFLSGER
jgi:hypothetical protein